MFTWSRNNGVFPKPIKVNRGKMENSSVVRRIKICNPFWKSSTLHPLNYEKRDHPTCYSVQFNSLLLWWYGNALVYGTGNMYIWKATVNAEKHIQVKEPHMVPSRQCQGSSCIFQQNNTKLDIAAIQTTWFHSRRVQVLDWPGCSPALSPTETFGTSWNVKYDKEDPLLLSS